MVYYENNGLYLVFSLNIKMKFKIATTNAGHMSLKSLFENEKIRKEMVNGANMI